MGLGKRVFYQGWLEVMRKEASDTACIGAFFLVLNRSIVNLFLSLVFPSLFPQGGQAVVSSQLLTDFPFFAGSYR